MPRTRRAVNAQDSDSEDMAHDGQTETHVVNGSGKAEKLKPVVSSIGDRALTATFFVTGINQGCMFIYLNIMPYLYRQYEMSPITYGYTMSIFAFLQFCASPILGRIGDVVGTRTVLILSMLSASAAHFTMGLADGVPMLILSRALSILMDALPAAQMVVADIVPPESRGKTMGKIMIPMSAGMILGPLIGGTLSQYFGPQGTLMLTWIFPVLSLSVILGFIPAKTKMAGGAQKAKKGGVDFGKVKDLFMKGDIPYLLVMRILTTLPGMIFMMNFGIAGIQFFKLSPATNGSVFSCLGVMAMVNNWFVLGMLGKRFTDDQLLKFAPLLSVAVYFFVGQSTEIWHVFALLYPLNLAYTITENQVMTRLTKSVGPQDTSTMVGIGSSLFHFSRTISPALGGHLMGTMGWPAIGNLGFGVSIAMATLALVKHGI